MTTSPTQEREAFRVGIIGAGLMARARAEALVDLPDVTVVAIASRSAERAARLAAEYQADVWDHWARLVEADLDGIVVATPNHVHAEQAIAALRGGKHVLVEYPLATTMRDVERMFEAAGIAGRVLTAGFNSLFPVRQIADRAEALGRPMFAYHDGINQRPDDFGWYLDDPISGGMIVLWGIEQIASLCLLVGRVRAVSAFGTDTFFGDEGNQDSYTIALAFENGATGCVQVSINAPTTVRALRIVYEHGVLDRVGQEPPTVREEGKEPAQFDLDSPPLTIADTKNWVAACRGQAERFPSKADVLHVHRVAFAAREAARAGNVITL